MQAEVLPMLATSRWRPGRSTARLLRNAPETLTTERNTVKICFVDTETTSLRPDRRAWEVGLILRDTDTGKDTEHAWFIAKEDLELGNADLSSLKIGRFYDRHPEFNGGTSDDPWTPLQVRAEWDIARKIEDLTRGAIIIGAVPNFDTEVLGDVLRRNGYTPAWHYHLVDIETLAAGARKLPPPWGFDDLLAAYGLSYAEEDRHTALGDARMVRDLYDAVLKAS